MAACVCMRTSACLRAHVHVAGRYVFGVIPLCVCLSDDWTVTSLAHGMMAVIMTFKEHRLGA